MKKFKKQWKQDTSARALTFFAHSNTVAINQELIDAIAEASHINGKCNARLCLHSSPESNFHEMIILEREGFFFPPHRHANKGESCHIIKGELAVFTFDDNGKVVNHVTIGKDGNILSRIGIGQWHLTLPLTDPVIYHEAKPGPFLGAKDSEFAPWAPERGDTKNGYLYLQSLLHDYPV